MVPITQQSTMKRKDKRRTERPSIALSMPMIAVIIALLRPQTSTMVMGFSIVGTELMQTRTFSRKSTDASTTSRVHKQPLLSATRSSTTATTNKNGVSSSPTIGVSTKDEHAVDEYLEFLDRRYRRLHEDRPSNEFPSVSLSVWKWLHQEDATTTTASEMKNPPMTNVPPPANTEDALYVLGVAGLASKRLLAKHHLLSSITSTTTTAATDQVQGTAIDVDYTATTKSLSGGLLVQAVTAETLGQFVTRVLLSRKALMEYQSKQLKVALLLLLRGPIQVTRSLWKLCGGTRTLKRTLSLTIMMSFIVFRTVSFILSNETA